ncbi:hypothetical protein [Nocardia arizonensis]|uniref:hypothetical protein n=1 Tax=Nocardia arizonensis TaxID=1141647 RepID=UPI0006CFB8DF|nr:hypothetical protein [Nocardia arizonensis]
MSGIKFSAAALATTVLASADSTTYFVNLPSSLPSPGVPTTAVCQGVPHLFVTSAGHFLTHPELHDEVLGPASIIVRVERTEQFLELVDALEGRLTATVHTGSATMSLRGR